MFYCNEDEWMSLKLTGAWPTLSLWLEQAPWGIAVYDKWVVLQINCSYCPCSATLTKGEWYWLLAGAKKKIMHSDELTLYSKINITTSSCQARIRYDFKSIQRLLISRQPVWRWFCATPDHIPSYSIKYKSVMNAPIQLKISKRLCDSQNNINQYVTWGTADKSK